MIDKFWHCCIVTRYYASNFSRAFKKRSFINCNSFLVGCFFAHSIIDSCLFHVTLKPLILCAFSLWVIYTYRAAPKRWNWEQIWKTVTVFVWHYDTVDIFLFISIRRGMLQSAPHRGRTCLFVCGFVCSFMHSAKEFFPTIVCRQKGTSQQEQKPF